MTDNIPYRINATEKEVARHWCNIRPVMREDHPPLLHPGTFKPLTQSELSAVLCEECAAQELNAADPFVPVPEEINSFYKMYRPSALVRAYCLEQALDTPAKIYYKYEGGNPSTGHKLNAAVAQAFYAKQQGLTGLVTQTISGQWGAALAMACAYFGLALKVYVSERLAVDNPHRITLIKTYGAEIAVVPAQPGARAGGYAAVVSEAWSAAAQSKNWRYAQDSVLDHVLLHQTAIGREVELSMEQLEVYPDILIGHVGGGSSWGGLLFSFMRDKLKEKTSPRFVAVESAACPRLTRGRYAYDFLGAGGDTPLAKMYTLGAGFAPDGLCAVELGLHCVSPTISKLYHDGWIDEAVAYEQHQALEAAVLFAKAEGTLASAESAYTLRAVIDTAKRCGESGEAKTILFGLTGAGHYDMAAYQSYMEGSLREHIPTDEELAASFAGIPDQPGEA